MPSATFCYPRKQSPEELDRLRLFRRILGLESGVVYLVLVLVASQCDLAVSTAPKYIQWYVHQVSGTVYEAVSELSDGVQPSKAAGSMCQRGMGISHINCRNTSRECSEE